jgi:hypothetical protein
MKNKSRLNVSLWGVAMGLLVGTIGCGGAGTGTADGGGPDGSRQASSYASCRSGGQSINPGKPCTPSYCKIMTDQSTGIPWQYAVSEGTCNATGVCVSTTLTMCGDAVDNPCVGGGDAGVAAHCSMN